jgi:hypothetical protein
MEQEDIDAYFLNQIRGQQNMRPSWESWEVTIRKEDTKLQPFVRVKLRPWWVRWLYKVIG